MAIDLVYRSRRGGIVRTLTAAWANHCRSPRGPFQSRGIAGVACPALSKSPSPAPAVGQSVLSAWLWATPTSCHWVTVYTTAQGSCAEWRVIGWKLETSTRLSERRARQEPLTSRVLTPLCLPGLCSLWIFKSVSSSSAQSSYLLQCFAQSLWAYSLEKISRKCLTYQARGSYVLGRKTNKQTNELQAPGITLMEYHCWEYGAENLCLTDTRFFCVGENLKTIEHQ